MMQNRRLLASATIIAAVIIVSFALSVPHTKEGMRPALMSAKMEAPSAVKIRDSYKKGVHTLSGTVTVPTACTTVTAEATVAGDASSTASIALSLAIPQDSGVCLAIPTDVPFTATIAAPAGLPITAAINGEAVSTSVL